jgi:hypothetical protein
VKNCQNYGDQKKLSEQGSAKSAELNSLAAFRFVPNAPKQAQLYD